MKVFFFTRARTERGFTLVESLIAISILLLVIIGPMTIAARGMQSGFYANEQMTAVYLAQEGIEWVQKLRDDVALSEYEDFLLSGANANGDTMSWYSDSSIADCKTADGCDIDISNGIVRDCSTPSSCNLKISTLDLSATDNSVYGYGVPPDWSDSMYTRVIKFGTPVQESSEDVGVPVTVTVSWTSNILGDREVVLQTWVYDQYKRFE